MLLMVLTTLGLLNTLLDLLGLTALLLSSPLLLIVLHILRIRILVTVQTNAVPGKLEQTVHALEGTSTGLRHGEPDPETTHDGDSSEAPECALGRDTALGNRQEHVGHGTGVAVLVGKVQSHSPGRGQSADAQGEQLGSQKVLHGVPAESPAHAGDVDHGDGATADTPMLLGKDVVVVHSQLREGCEEAGDVHHGQSLQGDTDEESTLATNDIDEEKSARNSSDKLDDTKDSRDEETFLLPLDADQSEQIGSIQSDGASARPLGEELHHGGEVQTVEVALVENHLLDLAQPADTLGRLELVVQGSLDTSDLTDDVLAVGRLVAELGQHVSGLLRLALLDQESRGLELEEGEDHGDTRKHDVQTGGDKPLVVAVLVDVEVGAIVGEVGEDDADVDGTREEAGADTADGGGRDLGDVDGTDDGGLTDAQTGDEATRVDGAEVAVHAADHEDDDADGPEGAEEAGGPDTTDAITDDESAVCC